MPADYKIDKTRRIVFSVLSGILTNDDIIGHQQRLACDPDFGPGFSQLVDARGVSDMKITRHGIQSITSANLYGRGSRRAIVATDPAIYGMARMFEMMRNGEEEIEVFGDANRARDWLGLEPENVAEK